MRALFITRKFPPSLGGMEIYSKELYDAFIAAGANVELHKPATTHFGRPALWQMVLFFATASWKLIWHGRRYDSLLIGDFALATLAVVAKLATLGRLRTVVALHGNDLYFLRKRGMVASLYRLLCRLVVSSRALDAAVANSEAIRAEAHRHGLPPATVIPLATVVPPLPEPVIARGRRLLFAGRLIRYKGLSWFVREVWPRLDESLELLVAGQVWDAEELACIEGGKRITYLGAVPYSELPMLRATAIACIMPNLPPAPTEQDEGFGLVALEGPAVGTPTVASSCGGIPDAIIEGITGFLLPPLDVDSWVKRLDDLSRWTEEQRLVFAASARAHVSEHYNWKRVAEQTLAVLDGRL